VEQYPRHVMKKEMQSKSMRGVKKKQPLNKTWSWRIEVLFADLNKEEAQPERPPEAIPVAQPDPPTEHERDLRRLTHLPFAPWCEFCTNGKARQDHPRP